MTRIWIVLASSMLLPAASILSITAVQPTGVSAKTPNPIVNRDLGYGFNVAAWEIGKMQEMGFNWIKVFNAPGDRLPLNVLLRVSGSADNFNNQTAYRQEMANLAQNNGAHIDAYEIGNEVNLDASYGWGDKVPPVAADYVTVLCIAYEEIKKYDPTAIVISAGLAPTGRVTGNWEGHPGHNGLYQDDREYLREMIAAGASDCMDAVGYHNYGFSADYDAEPDEHGGTAQTNCVNGFCFRGVEKIYDLMVAEGIGDKKIWTTEYGWITDPGEEGLAHCKDDATWQGRLWQIVSQQKQAENLAGSFAYAAENWPWMGGMIVFNLNFNEANYYQDCEQMRFYSVAGRPAETALQELPKAYEQIPPQLTFRQQNSLSDMVTPEQLPFTKSTDIVLSNIGGESLTYTISFDTAADIVPTVGESLSGVLEADATTMKTPQIAVSVQPTGTYTGVITIDVEPSQVGFPLKVPIDIHIVETIEALFLPYVAIP